MKEALECRVKNRTNEQRRVKSCDQTTKKILCDWDVTTKNYCNNQEQLEQP